MIFETILNNKPYFFLAANANLQKFYQSLQSYKMSNLENEKTYGLFDNPLNKKLISDFQAKNENVLIFPSILPEKTEISDKETDCLRNLADFDWLIFTDIFAADFFIENLREQNLNFFDLDAVRICALGEVVSDRLRFVQIHADVIPSNISDEAVFTAVSDYIADHLAELRFAVFKENKTDHAFIEKLKNLEVSIEEIAVYQAKFENESELTKLKTLIKGGAVDEFIFSSAEDVLSFKFLFPQDDLILLLKETALSATSEVAFQSLLEFGLRPLYFHK